MSATDNESPEIIAKKCRANDFQPISEVDSEQNQKENTKSSEVVVLEATGNINDNALSKDKLSPDMAQNVRGDKHDKKNVIIEPAQQKEMQSNDEMEASDASDCANNSIPSSIHLNDTEDQIVNDSIICDENKQEESPFPSVVDRYFTRFYKVNLPTGVVNFEDFKTNRNDVRVLWHSNKISLVTLAPSHPVYSPGKTVTEVSFKVTLKCDRANNKVSGKRKRGAQWLNPESPLCIITMSDGEKYTVHSGIRGNLIEVNENLLKHPQLLTEKPETEGHIAIIMMKLQERDSFTDKLLNETQYKEYLKHIPEDEQ